MNDENIEKNITPEEAYNEVLAATDALVSVVSVCEEARQFMAVARLAIKNNNAELATIIISIMIERMDPILQDFYKDIPDGELVDIVKKRIEEPKIWNNGEIEYVKLSREDIEQLKATNIEDDGQDDQTE